jgi:hypothetical protein
MISHEEWHKSFADRIIRLADGLVEMDVPVAGEKGDPEGRTPPGKPGKAVAG